MFKNNHLFANKMSQKKILITSALPYVNNVPHLGNLMCIISADVYARFQRILGKEVLSVLGTDEHGTTTQTKAIEEGMTPKELTDKYYKLHTQIYEWFNTEFDCLGRTTSQENKEITQDIFKKLDENGYILQKETEQYFDEKKELFLADRFIQGTCPHCSYEKAKGDQCESCGKLLEPHELKDPISTISQTKPILKKTTHLYLDLPKISDKLTQWIDQNKENWTLNAQSITQAWLDEKLQPRCITRDLTWGVPVPKEGFENKVFYSWFDAPIGYIVITAENLGEKYTDWWKNPENVKLVQFMGKDNCQFHSILFPSYLLGTNEPYTLVDTLSINEYLNYDDGKFSKSQNRGIFGNQAKDTGISADAYRFYLMAIRPETEDTNFDWLDFSAKINKELIGNYGNLVNRVLSFTNRFFEGVVPKITADDCSISQELDAIKQAYEDIQLKTAVKHILSASKKLNQYFQDQQPWMTIKTDKEKAGNALAVLLNRIVELTIAIAPITPMIAQDVFSQIQLPLENMSWNYIGTITINEGHKLGKDAPLVQKIVNAEELRQQYSGETQEKTFPADFRVAKITSVEQHPDADKLYVIQLDVGECKKQIVSGLRDYYTKEELVGKSIILVHNLKPAKLRGIESQGMLLAGENKEKKVKVLEVKFSKPGEKVQFDGYTHTEEQITIDEFFKYKITVQNKNALYEKKVLQTPKERVHVDLGQGVVR